MTTNIKNTAKHTAGEWLIGGKQVNNPYEIGVWDCGTFKLAKVYGTSPQEAEANAALIAAAPVLLEALKQLLDFTLVTTKGDEGYISVQQAKTAIKAATPQQ